MFEKGKENLDYVRSHQFLLAQAIELAIVLAILSLILWSYVLRDPVIQFIYGSSYEEDQHISSQMTEQNLIENKSLKTSAIRGMDIDLQMKFSKKIKVTAAVLNIKKYGFWGTYVRGSRGNPTYDTISPYDMTLAFGSAGLEDNFKLIDVKEDYRYLEARVFGRWNGSFNNEEIKSYMIIPSSKRIEKGLSLLKKGDMATVEGYITHLEQGGDMKSAAIQEEDKSRASSNQGKYEVRNGASSLKRDSEFLYLTEIIFDNSVFK